MSNPITGWIKARMETDIERETKFEDRVAHTSISAVKGRDQRKVSHLTSGYYRDEPRTRGFDHFFVAHSTLKAHEGGKNSSASALEFYNEQGAKKRERMLAQFKEEA